MYENVLKQIFSSRCAMIVVPEVRQSACNSVEVSQSASRPLNRLRMRCTPGRINEETSPRIENIDGAIDFCSYVG